MRKTSLLTANEVAILADTSASVVEKAVEQKDDGWRDLDLGCLQCRRERR
jgi:hypothetical protein